MGTLRSNSFWSGVTRVGTRVGHVAFLAVFGVMQTYPTPALALSLDLANEHGYERFLEYVYTHQGAVLGTQSESEEEDDTTVVVTVSAYTSTVAETDSTPLITASGETVRWQVAAANWLPFGTRFKMGGQTFIVYDRMNARYTGQRRVDIWMPNHADAVAFGVRKMELVVLPPL